MLNYDNPGVYIEEVESGLKPVDIAGTSTAAFLGFTKKGVSMTPTLFEKYTDFTAKFGDISEVGDDLHNSMAFAVRAFFQNGGRNAYVVNVAKHAIASFVNVTSGRSAAPNSLFILKCKESGKIENPQVAYLTPKGDIAKGMFDFAICEYDLYGIKVIESYTGVTLAPFLEGSIERVLEESSSRFQIEIDPSVVQLVYPSVNVEKNDLQSANEIKIQVGGEPSYQIDWRFKNTESEEENITKLRLALGTGIDVKDDGSRYVFILKTKLDNISLSIQIDANSNRAQKTRGALFAELFSSSSVKAVLSHSFKFVPDLLLSRYIDVRIGGNYARRVYFDALSKKSSTFDLINHIKSSLSENITLSSLASMLVTVEKNQIRIQVGENAPSGTSIQEYVEAGEASFFSEGGSGLLSPSILIDDEKMTLEFTKEDGSWSGEPKEVIYSPDQSLEDVCSEINRLNNGATGAERLVDAAIDDDDPYVIKLTVNRKLRILNLNTETFGKTLGFVDGIQSQEVISAQTAPIKSHRIVSIQELGSLNLEVEEDGATNGTLIIRNIEISDAASLQSLKEKIETVSRNGRDSPPSNIEPRVEFLRDKMLLWDSGNDISILDTTSDPFDGSALLGLSRESEALTAPLNELQQNLPMSFNLSSGDSGVQGNTEDYREALSLLEIRPEISIVCLPGNAWDKGVGRSYEIIEEAIIHAEKLQDRMVIVDPPKPSNNQSKWIDAFSIQKAQLPTSSYAAIYYPWVSVNFPTSSINNGAPKKTIKVSPSGFAAGVWSRMDQDIGVWRAPAGVNARLYGVESFCHELTDSEGGSLNNEGINALRSLPGFGSVIWGARTAATKTKPEWRYLPVRRTVLMIEDSLKASLVWAIHHPNRPQLWSDLRLNIESFLDRLFRAGAFQPDNPREAYFVQCGLNTTMHQADIDAGVLRVRVGIAPVRPAEFIVIEIEQINVRG